MTRDAEGIRVALTGRLGNFALDAAFQAPARGVTALFGPSGCGKTTILRCLAGLTRLPGRVSIGDEVWQDSAIGQFVPAHRRETGYVFQEASLFPHLSVRDNLLYGARRSMSCGAQMARELDEISGLLGIEHLIGRGATALSGGERQRVAVGRALLSRPRVLLMDEPLSALDRATKYDILPYLERLAETLRMPIVYVSHDPAEVARLARHVVVLAQGTVTKEASAGEILSGTDFACGDGLPQANTLIEARIAAHHEDGLTELRLDGGALFVPRIEGAPGASVRVRIGAQDVMLATERPQRVSSLNILEGTVAGILPESGPAALVRLRCGSATVLARVTKRSVAGLGLVPGTHCYAVIKSVAFSRFDVGTALDRGVNG